MTAPEPTQPLTDEELAAIARRADIADSIDYVCDEGTMTDLRRLLAEVYRLRHDNEHHQRYRYTAEQNAYYAAKDARELREELDALLPIASPHRTTKAERERNWLHGAWESFAPRAKAARAAANRWAREADRLEEWTAKRKAEKEAGTWPPCQGCAEHPALDQSGEGQANGG
jgi:hypothetical protein